VDRSYLFFLPLFVDRSYLFFLPLHSLVARAGDTACVEQTVQNQEPVGTLGEAGAERASKKKPAQIRIAEKKISTAVITHMAKNRVRRCRAMRRGSTCGHIRAPNSKTDG
jgi:hypothetical protein